MMHKLSLIQAATCLQFVVVVVVVSAGAYRLTASSAAAAAGKLENGVRASSLEAGVSSLAANRLPDQSSEISNGPRQVRSVCLWDCSSSTRQKNQQQQQQQHYQKQRQKQKQKQNTTRLLLFTRASGGGGEEPAAAAAASGSAEAGELGATSFTKFSTPNELRESGFQAHHHTILMIHGFRGSGISRQPWALETKELALAEARPPANVLFADWSHHARVLSYLHALEHISEVAEDLFSVFERFQVVFPGFRMERMEIIGHSLGAHIAGLLGQMMRGQLSKITALGFLLNSEARSHLKLSRHDANYVIAYHTDTRYFGTSSNVAHRDVYFGDGSNQPACGREHFAAQFLPSTCNHRLSTRYSSTYMGHCLMVGYLCPSYSEYASGACGFCDRDSPDCVLVGHKWQYYAQLSHLKSSQAAPNSAEWSEATTGVHNQTGASPQWTGTQRASAARYFIEVLAEKPYCAFTYQVVALFPELAHLSQLKHLELVLVGAHSGNQRAPQELLVRVRLTNQRHLNGAKVFRDSWGQVGLEPAEQVFTGLALVQQWAQNSSSTPLRFNEALVVGEHVAGSGWAQSRGQLEEASKVFVNYMSHIGFEERAASSGPLRLKWISGQRVARQ